MFSKTYSKYRCCEVETLCGRNLKEGVVFVAFASLVISVVFLKGACLRFIIMESIFQVISVVFLLSAIACLITISNTKELYNKNPMIAVNLIFGLVIACLSSYQIIISILLLWQAIKTKGNIFICSLWYVSHISLLTMYFLLFSAKVAVCSIKRHNITAVITIFIGVVYQATYIYFAVVVNSYLHSLHQDRYF